MKPIEIRLPDAGAELTGAELLQWHASPGQSVSAGETLASVDTGDALLEIRAPFDGALVVRGALEGDWLEPGALLGLFQPAAGDASIPASLAPPVREQGMPSLAELARELRLELESIHGIDSAPLATRLQAARPNPFRGGTHFEFSLAEPSVIEFTVFDVLGREVRHLAPRQKWPAGTHSLAWDGRREDGTTAGPGMYFARLQLADRTLVRMVVKLDR